MDSSLRISAQGVTGHQIPIYFLDTNLDENLLADQVIAIDHMSGGDKDHRDLQRSYYLVLAE